MAPVADPFDLVGNHVTEDNFINILLSSHLFRIPFEPSYQRRIP